MKKFISGMILAGLVVIPVLSRAADAPPPSVSEQVTKSVAEAEAAYQKGLALKTTAQQASDQAAANLDKARTDLKLAQASGDKDKIKAAHAALVKAQALVREKTREFDKVNGLVGRLKSILDKAKDAALTVAAAKNPAEVREALNTLQGLVRSTTGVLASIGEVMKPHPRVEIIGVTVPATTVSTTLPKLSPTPVGLRL